MRQRLIELWKLNFYPRSPCGERPKKPNIKRVGRSNFYPRSPCGERQAANGLANAPPQISIHALLAESDYIFKCSSILLLYFYPRSPCGERPRPIPAVTRVANFYPRSPCGERRPAFSGPLILRLFLSTLSLRRATKIRNPSRPGKINFYPRSPCGERPAIDK